MTAYIAGTFDTKARELLFVRDCLRNLGLETVTVDLSTAHRSAAAQVQPDEVASYHPHGASAVFTGDRGSAVSAMALAFARFLTHRHDLSGIISAGGSGGTALATQGMQSLPIGVPKVMVSTMASGDVKPYVGATDICMMYAVTDISGINRISERILSNAAHALAGMLQHRSAVLATGKPVIGLTMFGVTTPCVQAVTTLLQARYDTMVFHATGAGGQSMEKLVESNLLMGVLDITTTEVADELVGGVLSAGPNRFDVYARVPIPYVGSVGALDMVNFGPLASVPALFRDRKLYQHNANVTLMRTTPEECAAIGTWIANKLNNIAGPVRFLIPEGGVSALDAPEQPFCDPAADLALFRAIEHTFKPSAHRQLIKLPLHINDPQFAQALASHFDAIATPS